MVSVTFDDSWLSQYTNAVPILNAAGLKGTFYLTTEPVQGGWSGFMTPAQVQTIAQQGHEIAGHTVTHPSLITLSSLQIMSEVGNSKTYLQNLTGKTVTSFAYPYGEFNSTAKSLVQQASYTSARGVDEEALNVATSDKYNLYSSCIESNATFAQVKAQIDKAKAQKQWYILCIHEVKASPGQYDTSTALFQQIVSYIKTSGIKVVTVAQGRALMAN
jgi:peptidoglycan/xylan/chitin deacetylase (PgdA/CDA1 family)